MNVQNYEQILKDVSEKNVQLVAVSKLKPAEKILELYNYGHKVFGENYVQELVEKTHILPKDIEWHFLGHLQSKKVKQIAPFVHTIHAVDSIKLLNEIEKRAEENNRTINCLIQVHIAKEQTKFGFSYDELDEIIEQLNIKPPKFAKVIGLMGMATFTEDQEQIRHEFNHLRHKFEKIKSEKLVDNEFFEQISMGMSADYKIAIEEGSTIIRVGSLLFGNRS